MTISVLSDRGTVWKFVGFKWIQDKQNFVIENGPVQIAALTTMLFSFLTSRSFQNNSTHNNCVFEKKREEHVFRIEHPHRFLSHGYLRNSLLF